MKIIVEIPKILRERREENAIIGLAELKQYAWEIQERAHKKYQKSNYFLRVCINLRLK